MQSVGIATLAAVASLTTAIAGTAPKEALVSKKESNALFEKLNATLETGYDSAYYTRGLWFSNNNVWTGLTLSFPATEHLSFSLGGVYTSSLETNTPFGKLKYSELDLIAGVSYDAGFAKFGLVYTYYNFFDTFSGSIGGATFGNADRDSALKSASDIGFTVSKSFGPVNTTVGYWYDLRINGQYFEASADCPIKVTPWLSVVPALTTGYGMDYYSYPNSGPIAQPRGGVAQGTSYGWTHIRAMLSTPIQLTESASFVPYMAVNFSGRSRDALNAPIEGKNDFYFGSKLSLSF